jgi:hypothetical protein
MKDEYFPAPLISSSGEKRKRDPMADDQVGVAGDEGSGGHDDVEIFRAPDERRTFHKTSARKIRTRNNRRRKRSAETGERAQKIGYWQFLQDIPGPVWRTMFDVEFRGTVYRFREFNAMTGTKPDEACLKKLLSYTDVQNHLGEAGRVIEGEILDARAQHNRVPDAGLDDARVDQVVQEPTNLIPTAAAAGPIAGYLERPELPDFLTEDQETRASREELLDRLHEYEYELAENHVRQEQEVADLLDAHAAEMAQLLRDRADTHDLIDGLRGQIEGFVTRKQATRASSRQP